MSFPLNLLKRYLSVKTRAVDDTAAFQHEAVKHLTSLYNFALGLAKNNQDDAADLVQETYLRAMRFQNRFQPGTKLRTASSFTPPFPFFSAKRSILAKFIGITRIGP